MAEREWSQVAAIFQAALIEFLAGRNHAISAEDMKE